MSKKCSICRLYPLEAIDWGCRRIPGRRWGTCSRYFWSCFSLRRSQSHNLSHFCYYTCCCGKSQGLEWPKDGDGWIGRHFESAGRSLRRRSEWLVGPPSRSSTSAPSWDLLYFCYFEFQDRRLRLAFEDASYFLHHPHHKKRLFLMLQRVD